TLPLQIRIDDARQLGRNCLRTYLVKNHTVTIEEQNAHKAKINEQLLALNQEIAELEANIKPIGPENSIGRVNRMDAIQNQSVAEAGLRSKKLRRSTLHLALEKVEKPGFGICVHCKCKIQSARLMYMPESDHCVRCAH